MDTTRTQTPVGTGNVGGLPQNGSAKSIERTMNLTERGFGQYASDLYKDRRVFLREALQNALDAGAKHFSVTVEPGKITMIDDGSGMSREFIENDFKVIGKAIKNGGNDRGKWHVGMLSSWAPIISGAKDGEIKYSGCVEIVTMNGKKATEVKWGSIPTYYVTDLGETEEHGTSITISSTPPVPFLGFILRKGIPNANNVMRYLEETAVDTGIDITVNGKELKSIYEGISSVKGHVIFDGGRNPPEYSYEAHLDPKSRKLVVAEKGLKVTEINNLPVGGIINFLKGRDAEGKDVGISTLSRSGMVFRDRDVSNHFLNVTMTPYYRKLSIRERELRQGEMLDIAETLSKEGWYSGTLCNFGKLIVVDGKPLGQWQNESKVIWVKKPDRWSEKAKELGYSVLNANSNKTLGEIFKGLGIPHINTIAEEIAEAAKLRGPMDDAESIALDKFSEYLNWLFEILKSAQNTGYEKSGDSKLIRRIGNFLRADKDDSWEEDHNTRIPDKVTFLGPGIKVQGLELYLAEYTDRKIVAFRYGNTIGINVENKNVKDLLKKGRMDLLMTTVIHEFVHVMGYKDHDDEFYKAYNYLLGSMLLKMADGEHPVLAKVEKSGEDSLLSFGNNPASLSKVADGEVEILLSRQPRKESGNWIRRIMPGVFRR